MQPVSISQKDPSQNSDNIISSFISNIENSVKRVQSLIQERNKEKSSTIKEEVEELNQLISFLKVRLFKRIIDIKKHPEEMRIKYLRCLEPFYSMQGINRFIEYHFNVAVLEENKLGYQKKKEFEKEVNILFDLYKVKKTIETITTLQGSAAGGNPFPSQFAQEEQIEFLKTLKEIFKLFFLRLVKKEYQKELFNSFSESQLATDEIVKRKENGTSYLQPEVFKNNEHREKFITVFFSTLLRTKTSTEVKDLHFNYLNFELLKNEFLTDWMLKKLKGNKEKDRVLQNYHIDGKSVAEMIKEKPEKEAEILQLLPIEVFNDCAEQINQNVKEEDKTTVTTFSKKHGLFARVQKSFEQVKQVAKSAVKKPAKQKTSTVNEKTGPSENLEKLKSATEKANRLVEKISENVEARNEASEAIENFIDSARNDVVDEKEIKGFVENMIEKTSTDAISAIASLKKSDQTYAHCVDVSGIFSHVCSHLINEKNLQSSFENKEEIAFAGFLHDYGKAKVPKEILDSTEKFELDGPEMKQIRLHPQHGIDYLGKMNQPDYIHNLVLNHHVKFDPKIDTSYPENTSYDDVIWETRLLSIVDVYQALIGKRNYKKPWTPSAAIRFLDNLAGVEFDPDVLEDFKQIMGLYPIGSLVELNDGSVAFVMNISQEDPEKPQVVVVQNAEGETVENHALLDLQDEVENTIVKDLDAQEYFGEKALETFTNIELR